MNKTGIKNAIEISSEYFGIIMSEQFLLDNLDTFKAAFPAADDEYYTKEYPDEQPWWTFEAECESGGIYDTCVREKFGYAIGKLLVNKDWPIYADGEAVAKAFYNDLEIACADTEGVEYNYS